MDDAFFRSTDEVLNYFGTDPKNGLSDQQVKENTKKYGKNGMKYYYFIQLLYL